MSGNPAFFTLRQGGPAPVQAPHMQGNPVPMNQAVPRSMMPNPQHQQYQQLPQLHPQQLHPQHQQPHHTGVPRHSGTPPQWTPEEPRQRRVVEKSDIRHERMTESDMREFLSSYSIYRFEKVSGSNDEDDEGRAAQPTWENVFRTEIRDMSKQAATRRVRELDSAKSLAEKKAALIPAQQRQVENLLEELEGHEGDARFCFVLAQLDRQTEKLADEEYLLDERNWGRLTKKERELAGKYYGRKAGKKVVVSSSKGGAKEKERKGQKKVTTSITAFYKRMPRPNVDVAAMYQERLAESGRAAHPAEDAERTYQQQHAAFSHPQQMQGHQQQGAHYPIHPQHPQNAQVFQQPQYPQQHPQQQYPQQQFHLNPQYPQQPHPIQQTQLPVRTKTPLPAVPRNHTKPIVIHGAPGPEIRDEPAKGVKVIHATAPTKNRPRERHYQNPSPRSSRSSMSEDIFSLDSETTRSSAPSDPWGDKRGRTKRRGKARERSESGEWSRSRSRGTSRARPEAYGLRRQHVLDDYVRYGRATLGGERASGPMNPPPPPPPPTEPGISPAALKTVVDLVDRIQGNREARRHPDEPASPRVEAKRPATQGQEDEAWAGDKVYERRYEGQAPRSYEKAYHPAEKMYPAEKAYHPSEGTSSRAYGKEYHPAPTQAYDKYRPASDYSDDYEYTHIAAPRARAQSPERRDDREAFRQPSYVGEESYMSGGRGVEEPYMSGGQREEVRNPFAPRRRYDLD